MAAAARAARLLASVASHCTCPAHAQSFRGAAGACASTEYAFEVAAASIRFGRGAAREVGADCAAWGARRAAVIADPNVAALDDGAEACHGRDV